MKVSYRIAFLLAVLGAQVVSAANTVTIDSRNPYMADGVIDTTPAYEGLTNIDLMESTRFYDSTKGADWVGSYSNGTERDSNMCWAHVAANSISYWQSYYGSFYQGNAELPQGSLNTISVNTWETDAATGSYIYQDVANPQELGVFKAFFNNWDNYGQLYGTGTDWYFKGDSTVNNGGYYTQYFGNAQSTRSSHVTTDVQGMSLTELKPTLLTAMGLGQVEGSTTEYIQKQVGMLAALSIAYDVGTDSDGHALTCYGFTTDTNGNIATIRIADSDDAGQANLQELYLREEDGKLMLYRDKDFTLKYGSKDYYLRGVSYIDTPEILQMMYDSSTGGAGKIYFSTQESSETHTVTGTLDVGEMEFESGNHAFKAGEDASIRGTEGITIRNGAHFSSEVALGKRDINIEQNGSFTYETSTDAQLGKIEAATGATVHFRNTSADTNITYQADTLQNMKGGLTVGDINDAYATYLQTSGDINVQQLELNGRSALSTDGTVKVSGHLQSMAALQAATTFSLKAAVQGPVVDAHLDLTTTQSFTTEQTISLNGHQLILSSTNAITLTLPYALGEMESFLLFDDISALVVDGAIISSNTTFDAADFFVGDGITGDYKLLYTQSDAQVGSLMIINTIPEPTTATLGLLALVSLAARRRRA